MPLLQQDIQIVGTNRASLEILQAELLNIGVNACIQVQKAAYVTTDVAIRHKNVKHLVVFGNADAWSYFTSLTVMQKSLVYVDYGGLSSSIRQLANVKHVRMAYEQNVIQLARNIKHSLALLDRMVKAG